MNKIAIIQSIYHKDNPKWAELSFLSIIKQDFNFNDINYYLCIDGPIGIDLKNTIEKYKSYFHKIIINEKCLGLPNSLNRLIDSLENEEYIFRMDSDDISLPNRINKQIKFLENNTKVDICGAAIIEIDKCENRQKTRKYYQKHEDIVKNLYKGTAVGHPTVCFRKRALCVLKKYNEEIKLNEDIELWFRAINNNLIFYNLDEPLLLYRKSDNFYSRRSIKKAFGEFIIYWKGCNNLYGFGWRNIFPFIRLIFRLLPFKLVFFVYNSNFRNILFNQNSDAVYDNDFDSESISHHLKYLES